MNVTHGQRLTRNGSLIAGWSRPTIWALLQRFRPTSRAGWVCICLICLGWQAPTTGFSQVAPPNLAARRPVAHYAYRSNQPTGSIGAMQVARGVAPAGYVQPVKVVVPEGAIVEVAGEGTAFSGAPNQLLLGLIVGQPYRFKVSSIPRNLGQPIYPSIELIGRLHPPEGERDRFPIPVEFAQEDLELAIQGHMVIRVVYLENPNAAFPEREHDEQRYLDVLPAEDPLQIADELGRPMAIVRIGSRVPLNGEGCSEFYFGSPHVEWIGEAPMREPVNAFDNLAPIINPNQLINRSNIGAAPQPPTDENPAVDAPQRPTAPSEPPPVDDLDMFPQDDNSPAEINEPATELDDPFSDDAFLEN